MRQGARAPVRVARPLLASVSPGLLAASLVFDLIDLATGTGAFHLPAYHTLAAGLLAGLLAVPFQISAALRVRPGSHVHRRARALQVVGTLGVLALFAGSWLLRAPEAGVPAAAVALSLGAAALAGATIGLGTYLTAHARGDANAQDSTLGRLRADAH